MLIIVPASVVVLLVVHKVHIRSTNLSSLVVVFPFISHTGATATVPAQPALPAQ